MKKEIYFVELSNYSEINRFTLELTKEEYETIKRVELMSKAVQQLTHQPILEIKKHKSHEQPNRSTK